MASSCVLASDKSGSPIRTTASLGRLLSVAVLVAAALVPPASTSAATGVSVRANPTAGTNLSEDGRLAGRVLAMVESGDRVYLAGEFTAVRAPAAEGGILDAATGAARPGFPRLGDGVVKAAVADGTGGWYVAGTFTTVEGEPRPGLANLTGDGRLGGWHPETDPPGTVKALTRSPTTGRVYLGGDFTAAGGQTRPGLAAVDGTTGEVDGGFVPDAGGVVRALAVSPDGGRLYAGGRVGPRGGSARRGLIAVDGLTGGVTPWDPGVVGRVDALAVAVDGHLYAGGDFGRAGGQTRGNLARFDPVNASVDRWPSATDGPVAALAVSPDGARLYAGGTFDTATGVQATVGRSGLAAFDTATGEPLTSWNPRPDGAVMAIAVSSDGGLLYAGGDFSTIGGVPRPGLGTVDAASGASAPGWSPDAGGTVDVLVPSGDLLLAGGRLDRVVERPVPYLVALGVTSGAWEPGFAPRLDRAGRALALAPGGGRLYVGGDFTSAGGVAVVGVAALDAATGAADPAFAPPVPNGSVQAVAVSPDGARLYVGGTFDSFSTPSGTVSRPGRLAALDAATGALLPWEPPADGGGAYTGQTGEETPEAVAEINTLAVSADGTQVHAGGTFLNLGGRSGLVSLDGVSGRLTAWQGKMDRPVNSLSVGPDGRLLYAATGGFGGTIQAFDPAARPDPVWMRRTDGDATAVVVSATTAYLGGHFDYVCESCGRTGGAGDDFRRHMAAFDAATGALDPWAPVANTKTGPYCAALGAAHLYIAGEFTRINDLPQPGFAQFPGTP